MDRTLEDRARLMLVGVELGEGFWVEAITTALYIRNKTKIKCLILKEPEREERFRLEHRR